MLNIVQEVVYESSHSNTTSIGWWKFSISGKICRNKCQINEKSIAFKYFLLVSGFIAVPKACHAIVHPSLWILLGRCRICGICHSIGRRRWQIESFYADKGDTCGYCHVWYIVSFYVSFGLISLCSYLLSDPKYFD